MQHRILTSIGASPWSLTRHDRAMLRSQRLARCCIRCIRAWNSPCTQLMIDSFSDFFGKEAEARFQFLASESRLFSPRFSDPFSATPATNSTAREESKHLVMKMQSWCWVCLLNQQATGQIQ